jgi:hypothetical protein
MDEAKKRDNRPEIEKVGVGWIKEGKNGRDSIKLSVRKEILIAYKNNKKGDNKLAPDFVIIKYIDGPKKEEK